MVAMVRKSSRSLSGRLTLALLIGTLTLTACRRESRTAPYAGAPVILISIDTLRADHLPAYGYSGLATPAIDSLRRDGILYRNAYAHVPMTLPSHVSILTGLLPYENGVRNNAGYRFDPASHDSLPMMLKRAGYTTGAAVSAFVLRGDTGLRSIFDFYDDDVASSVSGGIGDVSGPGSITDGIAEQWMATHSKRPFFFLHLFEPHWPYEAPEPFRSSIANPYDAEIAAADSVVGHFLERLKSLGIYDRAIIIFLSDHGEGLGDHGEGEHGVFLYREAIHVPLIVKLPRSEERGGIHDEPVELIDIMPTIAALVGAKPTGTLPGSSLFDLPRDPRRIYSETMLPRIHFGWSDLRSLIDDRFHYIDAPRPELYDLSADPKERSNIAAGQRRVYTEMRDALHAINAAFTAPAAVDPEEAGKLAALGYIGQARTSDDDAHLTDPKDGIADLEQLKAGSALERSGRLREAASAYKSLAERNPHFADAWLRLADVQERLGRTEAALDSCQRALEVAPVLAPDIALSMGRLLLQMNRFDEAAAHAQLAIRTSPGGAHHLLGRIALARGDSPTAEREAHLAMDDPLRRSAAAVLLAQVWTAQGRLTEALELLDKTAASARQPVIDLQATRGDVLARLERAADAEAAFHDELRSFPHNLSAYSRLALLYIASGRGADAEKVLENMVASNRSRSTALLASGVWKSAGDRRAAARWAKLAAELD